MAAAATPDDAVSRWARRWSPDDTVHLLTPTAPAEPLSVTHRAAVAAAERHQSLKEIGPVDVVVDIATATDAPLDNLRQLFLHLAHDGVWIVDGTALPVEVWRRESAGWAARLLDPDALPTDDAADGGPLPVHPDLPARRVDRAVAAAVASVTVGRDLLLATKRATHLLRLRDAEVEQVLARREPSLAVTELASRPAGVLRSRATVVSHEAGTPIPWLDESLRYPPLHLRHYRGRIGFSGASLVTTQTSVLPESSRRHLAKDPLNPLLSSATPSFGRVRQDRRPAVSLPGDHYLVDATWPGHFGHLMTELVARLWGWQQAKAAIPGLKTLFMVRAGDSTAALEHRLLTGYGIARSDIAWSDQPVWVDSLVTATSMWHNSPPHYVHPDLTETWDRLRAGLVEPGQSTPEKIFLSRSTNYARRTCRNAPEVERLFAARGFAVVRPEELDLGRQAALFAGARVIAGFGGSAMLNLLFARKLETLIVLNSESYGARNEHLFMALLGGTVHYFWSEADQPQPLDGWSLAASGSDWSFDFERNGDALGDLLGSL